MQLLADRETLTKKVKPRCVNQSLQAEGKGWHQVLAEQEGRTSALGMNNSSYSCGLEPANQANCNSMVLVLIEQLQGGTGDINNEQNTQALSS